VRVSGFSSRVGRKGEARESRDKSRSFCVCTGVSSGRPGVDVYSSYVPQLKVSRSVR